MRVLFLFLLPLLLALAGCGASSPEAAAPDVTIWAWNIAGASLQTLIPPFREQHPDTSLDVVTSGQNMQSRFLLALSAGVGAPDISQLQLVDAPFYARTRQMTDVTEFAAKYAQDFPASFWNNCVLEGRVYAIPWDMGPCAVFYKRHLFEQYGIEADSIETWEDYIAAGRTLVEKSGGKTKMLFLPAGQLEVMFEMLLQQTGGQVFDEEGRVAINSPEVFQVLEVLWALVESGVGANDIMWSHSFYASLKTDAVATYPIATWFGGTIRDHAPDTAGDWGVFRLPAIAPGGLRTSNFGGSVLVIPEQSPNQEAAWAFVEYALCTAEGQLEQYRNFDLFPAYLPTHSDPFFDEPVPFFGGQKVRQLFRQDIERIPPLNRTKDWMEAVRYIRQELSTWASAGPSDTQAALDALEYRLCSRLGRDAAPREER